MERADKQRNRQRLVAAASRIIDRDGENASLEQIAREAGVGSATLHRHFGSRRELLSAVFHERIEVLVRRADTLAAEEDERTALVRWFGEVAAYTAVTRGLAAALFAKPIDEVTPDSTCHAMTQNAGDRLLSRAVAAGAVRPDVTTADLLALANGVAVAAEGSAEAATRLVGLTLRGIAPETPVRGAPETPASGE